MAAPESHTASLVERRAQTAETRLAKKEEEEEEEEEKEEEEEGVPPAAAIVHRRHGDPNASTCKKFFLHFWGEILDLIEDTYLVHYRF